jgi:hypothetical protein
MRSLRLTHDLAVSAASAHTIFQELYVNGVSAGHTGNPSPEFDGVSKHHQYFDADADSRT